MDRRKGMENKNNQTEVLFNLFFFSCWRIRKRHAAGCKTVKKSCSLWALLSKGRRYSEISIYLCPSIFGIRYFGLNYLLAHCTSSIWDDIGDFQFPRKSFRYFFPLQRYFMWNWKPKWFESRKATITTKKVQK